MAEDRDKDAPSLEPPSLQPPSLFRRKKQKAPPTPRAAPEPAPARPAPAAGVEVATPPRRSPLTPPLSPSRAAGQTAGPPAETGEPREPWLVGRPAAALTGLFVGAVIVAATAGSLRLCTAVKGTSSCGNQGFFVLLAILAVAVLVGSTLLRAAAVPQPGSTSFLAVGLLSVAVLLFLVGSIFEWWMVVVIPLVSVATYLLSHWLTTTYIEPESDTGLGTPPEQRDVG